MTKQNSVLEKWRAEFAQPDNSDQWWTRLRAMDMFMELQAELYRLQDEPPAERCRHPVLVDNPQQPGVNDYICARCEARILVNEFSENRGG